MSPRRRKIIYTMIVVAFGLLIMTIGVVIGMTLKGNTKAPSNGVENNQNDNQGIDVGEPNPNTPIDENEDDNTGDELTDPLPDTLSEYESTRYDIKFSYPESLGEHKSTVNTEYFFNEQVTFDDSNVFINYTRFEGSIGTIEDTEQNGNVTTKQGYTGDYNIYRGGPDNNYGLFVRVSSPGTNGTSLVITSTATTLSEIQSDFAKVQTILDNLEFDFSNVPMGGCETSCK
jgi:hypothetical protein